MLPNPAAMNRAIRSVEAEDLVIAPPVRRLAATLGHDDAHWPAGVLPPLGHWLFHLPDAPRDAPGADEHPWRGGLLPAVGYLRRMWAGGRLRFPAPVPFGAVVMKRSTVVAIVEKPGMTFVTVRHDLSVAGASAVVEEHDLVFLPIAAPAAPKSLARPVPEVTRDLVADEALLFRYSALTFNAHRIHYDLAYARDVERYQALVVHGPLQAMLLIDLAITVGVIAAAFSFRARAPLYGGRRFTLAMAGTELWIVDEAGVVTMTPASSPLGARRPPRTRRGSRRRPKVADMMVTQGRGSTDMPAASSCGARTGGGRMSRSSIVDSLRISGLLGDDRCAGATVHWLLPDGCGPQRY